VRERFEEIDFAAGRLRAVRTGHGPDIVIVHSLLADRTAFDPVVPALAAKFRVTLVNLPGFHGSAVLDGGIDAFGDRIASVFDSGAYGPETIVVGNGFGGTVAVAMAVRHGSRFGRMVLSDVAAGFPPEGRAAFAHMAEKVEREGIGSVAAISARRVFHAAYLAKHPDAEDARRAVLLGIAPAGFIAACRALTQTDLVPLLPTIRNPTLVVCGELDAATPPALCRQLAQGIPGAQYVELPGCGHCPPLEQPETFLRTVEPFLTAA
jgi:pimeloyl-ACP methyl ester carboxylesterase